MPVKEQDKTKTWDKEVDKRGKPRKKPAAIQAREDFEKAKVETKRLALLAALEVACPVHKRQEMYAAICRVCSVDTTPTVETEKTEG